MFSFSLILISISQLSSPRAVSVSFLARYHTLRACLLQIFAYQPSSVAHCRPSCSWNLELSFLCSSFRCSCPLLVYRAFYCILAGLGDLHFSLLPIEPLFFACFYRFLPAFSGGTHALDFSYQPGVLAPSPFHFKVVKCFLVPVSFTLYFPFSFFFSHLGVANLEKTYHSLFFL